MYDNVSGESGDIQANISANAQEQNIQMGDAQYEQTPKEQPVLDEARVREIALEIARQETPKIAQSFTDKATNRINETIREKFKALDNIKTSLGLSDEQVATAKRAIVDEARYDVRDEEQAEPHQPAQQDKSNVHPIIAESFRIMQRHNIRIEEGDPEFEKYLKPHFSKPNLDETFNDDTVLAVMAKRERLASQKNNANVRSPGGVPGNKVPTDDISSIMDSAKLYMMGEKKIRGK